LDIGLLDFCDPLHFRVMALFGRHSQAELQRQERIQGWIRARSPFALFAGLFSTLSLLDFFTPLGPLCGITAIVLALRGRAHLRQRPDLLGHRLCRASLVLGALGFLAGVTFMLTMY
jgi:hypothetical protein